MRIAPRSLRRVVLPGGPEEVGVRADNGLSALPAPNRPAFGADQRRRL